MRIAGISPYRPGVTAGVRTTGLLLGAALAAWAVTIVRVRGMDSGPGTDFGGLGWYLGVWVTMTAAMMLPSVAPMVLLVAHVSRERSWRVAPFVFVAAYLAVWTLYGLAAYACARGVRALGVGGSPAMTGALVVVAGVYELSPLKSVCLRHCRGPLHFVTGGWRDGAAGAVRMGAEHGAYCVGCCWGLMLLLFALGVMSIFWMAVVAAAIAAQKLLPFGERLVRPLALTLIAVGVTLVALG